MTIIVDIMEFVGRLWYALIGTIITILLFVVFFGLFISHYTSILKYKKRRKEAEKNGNYDS